MKTILLSVFLMLPASAMAAARNVLLIIADDFGIDASVLYNTSPAASVAPTPNLAALAARGVRFTNACAYPLCSPTRSAILTGRYGFRTGTGTVVSAASNNLLKVSEFTLPDAFAANPGTGHAIKHFGKWHLGGGNTSPATLGGWPAFAGSLGGEVGSYTGWTKVVTDGTPAGTSSSTTTTYATTDIVNDAVSSIQSWTAANKPWFAWVAFNAPHTPFHLPSPITLCPSHTSLSGTAAHIQANQRSYYNAAVEAMDTEIGRLLAAVDFARTTVIFLGDNGTPGQVLQTPYPAGHGKSTLYEGGVRVPLIIRSPDTVAPGRTADGFTQVTDLYPTILEAAGLSAAATALPAGTVIDGVSLLPVLQNQVSTRSHLYAEAFDTNAPTVGGRALRGERYKIIRHRSGTDEFYDLQSDPAEAVNLLAGGVNNMTAGHQSQYWKLRYALGRYTSGTAPAASLAGQTNGTFSLSVPQDPGASQTLYRCTDLAAGFWAPVAGVSGVLAGGRYSFTDPAPPGGRAFYSILAETP